MIPRLVLIAFSITQPFLIETAIEFVDAGTKPNRYGYGLVGAFGITYLGIAVCLQSFSSEGAPLTAFILGLNGVVRVSHCASACNDPCGSN